MLPTLPIKTVGDVIRIGRVSALPAGAAQLPCRGGTLWVDPCMPERPHFDIYDVDQAREAIVALFGLAALQQVRDKGAVEPRGWALSSATRWAVLQWLQTWSPDALPHALVTVESAVLGCRLVDIASAEDADANLSAATPRLFAAADGLLAAEPVSVPGLAELTIEGLQAVVESGSPRAEGAMELLRRLADRTDRTPQASPLEWGLATALPLEPAGARLDASTPPPLQRVRVDTVDWEQVPAGAVHPGENRLRWRIQVHDRGWQIHVDVDPPDGGIRTRDPLQARLWSPTTSEPVVLVPLTVSDGKWSGTAPLPTHPKPDDADTFWADVTTQRHPRPCRRNEERAAALARRWSTRAVTRLRLGIGGGFPISEPDPISEGIGCLERARSVLEDLANAPQGAQQGWLHQHADDQEVQLRALLMAALTLMGEDHEVDDLGQEPPTARVASLVPDLAAPAWHRTLAETALLVPSVHDGW